MCKKTLLSRMAQIEKAEALPVDLIRYAKTKSGEKCKRNIIASQ